MGSGNERAILEGDFRLISRALEKLANKAFELDAETPLDQIEILSGGYSGARMYRVPIRPAGYVIARVVPRCAAKAEVECYGKYVEDFVKTGTTAFPTMFHPTTPRGNADPACLAWGLVAGEEMGVIILSDQRWANIAAASEPLGLMLSRTQVADEVTPGVTQALAAMEELRKFHRVVSGDQDFFHVFAFYNGKLPAALTVAWERSGVHDSLLRPVNDLCADYADRRDAQRSLQASSRFAFSPLHYQWSRRSGVPVYAGARKLYCIDVTGLPKKPSADQDLHFTGSITGTRYQYLTDLLRRTAEAVEGAPLPLVVWMSDGVPESFRLGTAAFSRQLTPPTDVLAAMTHWVSDVQCVQPEFDPPFWPSDGQAAPRFRKGVIHGDLHAGNILCLKGRAGTVPSYSIIDLELMTKDAPVAHDAARLEVDLLLRALGPLYEADHLDADEWICLTDRHFAEALKRYEAGEPPCRAEYAPASKVLLAVRRAVVGDCPPPERLTRLLEHLWCVFFNALQFFCYNGLPDRKRTLAWWIASYVGSQARNPPAWLAASTDPSPFRAVLSTLTKDDTEASARVILFWLEGASRPTELERPLWPWNPTIDAARQQVFQHLLADYWSVIGDGFSEIAARFVHLAVRSGPGTWTYEVPLTAKPSSAGNGDERDVDDPSFMPDCSFRCIAHDCQRIA